MDILQADGKLIFPQVSDVDVAFGGYPDGWFSEVLALPSADKKWEGVASSLFFKGGNIPINTALSKEYLKSGIRILKCVLGSFNPKHEHKEHVAGLILKSLCEEGS